MRLKMGKLGPKAMENGNLKHKKMKFFVVKIIRKMILGEQNNNKYGDFWVKNHEKPGF